MTRATDPADRTDPRTGLESGRSGLWMGGNDTLTISGAKGWLYGSFGDDHLVSADGSEDFDSCGYGTDDVIADASDIVAPNCETVTVTP